ncbi:PEP-CTERM sorting domain-containing protein [bacterium]|nr:MAG: PEP-CTERM sorting domain-containing protein [bacterium]
MTLKPFLFVCLLGAAISANAAFTYKVSDFQSSGVQNGDRSFVGTNFVGSSYKMDSTNIGFFGDATFKVDGETYGWNDPIRGDFGSASVYSLNPDRGINATHFAGESNQVKTGTIADVFGQNNLGYLLDGEDTRTWTLDLLYRQNGYITVTGEANKPELLMMERGANSRLGIRAILEGGVYSQGFIMNFNTSGDGQTALTDYTLQSTEIDGAQTVGALGLSLDAFDLAVGTKILGYQFYVDATDGTNWNGPDFIGFVAGQTIPTPQAVPEPASMAALGFGALALLRRRRKA